MMTKLILPHNFRMDDHVSSIVDVCSRGIDKSCMEKRAAMFDDRLKDIKLEKNCTLVHLITTGALESYGPNSNADGWNGGSYEVTFPHPKRGLGKTAMLDGGLEKYHSTFVTNPKAGIYRNHKDNKDPSKSAGKIVAECYNPLMKRGELLVSLDNDKWSESLEKIASGKPVCWSVGAVVPYDICSDCGHKRRTRAESCGHIRDHLLEMTKEGCQIFAYNDAPKFHDISEVFRPADKIAFTLRSMTLDKAASDDGSVMSGLDLAEAENYTIPTSYTEGLVLGKRYDRLATLRKLAAMEEELERSRGDGPLGLLKTAHQVGSGFESVDPQTLRKLAVDLDGALSEMGRAKVIMPLEDFLKLIMGDRFSEAAPHVPAALARVPRLFRDMLSEPGLDSLLGDGGFDGAPCASRSIRDAAASLIPTHGLEEGPVRRRITIVAIRRPDGGRAPSLEKESSEAGRLLAREYGKYLVSFGKDKPDQILRQIAAATAG